MNREKELESALRGLRRIIEEVGCGDWRDQNGKRFKDTPEWVRAYVVLHSTAEHPELERALDSASKGPENYRSGLSDGKRIARQQCAAIMAVCGYFSRMRGPDVWLHAGSWDEYPELFACAGVDLRSFQHGTRFYAGSAPVPAVQDFSLMHGGYCCECGHELCDTCAPLHPIMPAPAAQMDNPDVMARATKYARDIVTWLHRDHYADNTRFEPFDDLLGLLSQIDNMVCGWKELSVAAICNAYESGVGHRGRPTANVNPYREGTPEHEAYAIGAKGEAAQAEAKVATANEVLSLVRQYGNRCFIEGNHIGAGIGDQEYDEAASKSAYEKVASTIGSKFTPAEAKVADDVLGDAIYHIAALAHLGGLKDEPVDLLCAIRKLSLPWFDGSGTARDLERRVTRAMIAAKAKGGGK